LSKKVDIDIETTNGNVKGSLCPFRFNYRDVKAELILSNVLYEGGEKYSRNNWRGEKDLQTDENVRDIVETHLNHALAHIYKFLAGNENDIRNALCRVYMATAVLFQNRDEIPVVLFDENTKEKIFTKYDVGVEKWTKM
jgi:hypothetical protein